MLEIIYNNLSTVLVGLLVALVIFFAIRRIIKAKKNGGCSCGCEYCEFKDNCHKS